MIDFTTFNTCFMQTTMRLCGQVYPEFFHAPTMEEELGQTQEAIPQEIKSQEAMPQETKHQKPSAQAQNSDNKPTLH